jgi:hypothetical protein
VVQAIAQNAKNRACLRARIPLVAKIVCFLRVFVKIIGNVPSDAVVRPMPSPQALRQPPRRPAKTRNIGSGGKYQVRETGSLRFYLYFCS